MNSSAVKKKKNISKKNNHYKHKNETHFLKQIIFV